jgi:hypothetical protein
MEVGRRLIGIRCTQAERFVEWPSELEGHRQAGCIEAARHTDRCALITAAIEGRPSLDRGKTGDVAECLSNFVPTRMPLPSARFDARVDHHSIALLKE